MNCNWCLRSLPPEAFDRRGNTRKTICKTCCRNGKLTQKHFTGKMTKEEYEREWNGGEWGKEFDNSFA
jgi:hypothetical protein